MSKIDKKYLITDQLQQTGIFIQILSLVDDKFENDIDHDIYSNS